MNGSGPVFVKVSVLDGTSDSKLVPSNLTVPCIAKRRTYAGYLQALGRIFHYPAK